MRSRLPLLVCLGLVVLTVAAYAPLWRNEFIDLDDDSYISKNHHVIEGLTADGTRWAWTTFQAGMYLPLTWMSLQLDGSLFPLHDGGGRLPNPVVFHGQNLFWHTATVLLLFAVLRRMTGAVWRSAVVAALFGVHPMHVESVAWATERKDVLSAFFWVLTMFAYTRYVQTGKASWYAAVLASFVLGLLSKPMLVTLPFALLLLDVWPLQRFHWRRRPDAKSGEEPGAEQTGAGPSPLPSSSVGWLLLEKLPLFALGAGASWLTMVAIGHAESVWSREMLPLSARLANTVTAYGWYFETTFWPTGLALLYAHPFTDWSWRAVVEAGAVLGVVSLAVVLLARRMPWLAMGWLWFLGTLVPVIGLVQTGLQPWADRYSYVPHIGLFVAVVWTAAQLLARLRVAKTAQAVGAAACLSALAVMTGLQVVAWQNRETVWQHAVRVTTGNPRAHLSLGCILAETAFREKGPQAVQAKLQEARDHLETAAALRPKGHYLSTLGTVCLLQCDWPAAAKAYTDALALNPNRPDWWHDLGIVYLRQRRPEEAVQALERARALEQQTPDSRKTPAQTARSLAITLGNLGAARWQLGQPAKARNCWDEALQLNPTDAQALNGQGLLLLRQGQVQSAVDRFTAAVQTSPGLAQAYSNRGVALGRLDQWSAVESHRRAVALETDRQSIPRTPDYTDLALYRRRLAFTLMAFAQDQEAAKEYREALRLDGAWPQPAVVQAWKRATDADPAARDPASAFELASQACQATSDPPAEALDALAAAHAAAGRFTDAVKTARKALAKAAPDLALQIERRLQRYKQGKTSLPGSQPQRP